MLIELRVKNCFLFSDQTIFTLKSDMRNKKLAENVQDKHCVNVLKTAGIFGPNNGGKTCLVRCLLGIRQAFLDQDSCLEPCLFQENTVCSLGVVFLEGEKLYSYDFSYDGETGEYLYERFAEIIKDHYGNEREVLWLLKDAENGKIFSRDSSLEHMIPLISLKELLMHQVNDRAFEKISDMKRIVTSFARSMDIEFMSEISMDQTREIVGRGGKSREYLFDLIRWAGLYIDRICLEEDGQLTSMYQGKNMGDIQRNSQGTKKVLALAGYIIRALEEKRILVVDELDSSLHFMVAQILISAFHQTRNSGAQMIFTFHDINLLDCRKLFRKEQIWFVSRESWEARVYSLSEFTARCGVRDTTDIINKYKKGFFGAIPNPS